MFYFIKGSSVVSSCILESLTFETDLYKIGENTINVVEGVEKKGSLSATLNVFSRKQCVEMLTKQ